MCPNMLLMLFYVIYLDTKNGKNRLHGCIPLLTAFFLKAIV